MSLRTEKEEYLKLLEVKEKKLKYNSINRLFPEKGEYSRDKYPRHMDFFKAGKTHFLRAMISANQTGKSTAGCTELTYHVTGLYPDWWEGIKYDYPIVAIIAGDRGEIIKESLQKKLLGTDPVDIGTGLIPKDCIVDLTAMPGIPGGIGTYYIKHVSGGTSQIIVRAYQSGREAFEASVADFVLLDEKCPKTIFDECITRMASKKDPRVLLTFTPTGGWTDLVEYLLSEKDQDIKYVVTVGWDDVPHLSEETKKVLIASYSPHELDCRTKGIPYLGSGKIYNINEEIFTCPSFEIPKHWPRVFALDIGYVHHTAALWAAWDRESDTVYFYSEHKQNSTLPAVHADAILKRGDWIPGVIDTSSKRNSETDGMRIVDLYRQFGIHLYFVKKGKGSVEEGILEVYNRLASGRAKIFSHLEKTLAEIRLYRRDDNGKEVDENNDLMDAMRYLCRDGLLLAITEPNDIEVAPTHVDSTRSSVTGY